MSMLSEHQEIWEERLLYATGMISAVMNRAGQPFRYALRLQIVFEFVDLLDDVQTRWTGGQLLTAPSKSPDMPMLSSRSSALSPSSLQILSRQSFKHCEHKNDGTALKTGYDYAIATTPQSV